MIIFEAILEGEHAKKYKGGSKLYNSEFQGLRQKRH
jgi:hypothetical protein